MRSSMSSTSSSLIGSSRSLAILTIPGAPPRKLEIDRKSIFTGVSRARASSVRKNTAPLSTAISFSSRWPYFSRISAATSRMRAVTWSSLNRMRSIPGGAGDAIFENQVLKILLIKHLDVNMRINRAQKLYFTVFSRHQRLLHGGQFDVQIELRKIEIGGERLRHIAVLVPLQRKRARLVLPGNPVEIEQIREQLLARMAEGGAPQAGPARRRDPVPRQFQPRPELDARLRRGRKQALFD